MFCQKCGNSVSKDLKYCNACGTKLAAEAEDKDGTPGKMFDNILTSLVMIVMFGLGILVGLVAVLLGNGVEPKFVIIITVAYLGAVFGISLALLLQVPKLIDARLASGLAAQGIEHRELESLSTAQLGEYREPVMTVIDQTTKTLEKIPIPK